MNLSGVDLNLLLALDALLATGSVTNAARRIGITQPAMSNALRRLRAVFGDPILIRNGRTMLLTTWSVQVAPRLAEALQLLEASVGHSNHFDPAAATGVLTIAISDYWQFAVLPKLIQRLEREAPKVHLQAMPVSEAVVLSGLARGDASAAIFLAPRSFPGLHSETFVTDSYVGIARVGHAGFKGKTGVEEWLRHRQIVVTPRGPWFERLSEVAHGKGLSLVASLSTAHQFVALDVASRTNAVAIVPRQIAKQALRRWPIKILPPPIPLGTFSLALYWHVTNDKSPLHRWFRRMVTDEAKSAYFGKESWPRSVSPESAR